jgi:hypothetical protein
MRGPCPAAFCSYHVCPVQPAEFGQLLHLHLLGADTPMSARGSDIRYVYLRLNQPEHDDLRAWAWQRGISISAATRVLLRDGLRASTASPPIDRPAAVPTSHDPTVELATLIAVEQILLLVQTFTTEGAEKAARLLTQAGDAARRRLTSAGFTEEPA